MTCCTASRQSHNVPRAARALCCHTCQPAPRMGLVEEREDSQRISDGAICMEPSRNPSGPPTLAPSMPISRTTPPISSTSGSLGKRIAECLALSRSVRPTAGRTIAMGLLLQAVPAGHAGLVLHTVPAVRLSPFCSCTSSMSECNSTTLGRLRIFPSSDQGLRFIYLFANK